jgi:hypothetical protein
LFWRENEIFAIRNCSPAAAARKRQEPKTMDGTQATQIRSLLLEAADAIDRANAIVSMLDSDDQALLATALDEISSALHFELLQKLYLRYPRLAEDGAVWDGAVT